jgi:transcription initiation factor TFIID TATA-box-binding protein
MDSENFHVVNTIFTSSFNTTLPLNDLSAKLGDVGFCKRKFSGAIIRIPEPRATILLFKNGKLVVAGAKSEDQAKAAVQLLTDKLTDFGYEVKPKILELKNVVVSCSMGHLIDMYKISNEYKDKCMWVPEFFTGATYKFNKNKPAVAIIFASGKFNLMGARTVAETRENYILIKRVLNDCAV